MAKLPTKPHPYDAMRQQAQTGLFMVPQLVRLRAGVEFEGEWRGPPMTNYFMRKMGFPPNRYTRIWYHWNPIDTEVVGQLFYSVAVPTDDSEAAEEMAKVFMDIFNATRID